MTELTRRGYALLAVLVTAVVLGWLHGGRSLNYVAMPALGVLLVGYVGLVRLPHPRVERDAPTSGFAGEEVTVTLDFDAKRDVPADVRERVPAGLGGDVYFETSTAGETTYDLSLDTRGVHELGPLTVTLTDTFGLWERTHTYERRHSLVVYPRVRPLHAAGAVVGGAVGLTDDRGQFDGLRQYQHGDALRDVNWKASAKHPSELVVTTYTDVGSTGAVHLAVDVLGGDADAAAEAAASLAVHLLETGVPVTVSTSTEGVELHSAEQIRPLLETLARLGTGAAPEEADVRVRGPTDGGPVELVTDAGVRPFSDLFEDARRRVVA